MEEERTKYDKQMDQIYNPVVLLKIGSFLPGISTI